jgi:hypothetical protein
MEKSTMPVQNAIPEHLPKKLTIAFWLWNYFYGIKKGEYYHDLERCFVELFEPPPRAASSDTTGLHC